jgi:hypothetical protein
VENKSEKYLGASEKYEVFLEDRLEYVDQLWYSTL